MAVLCKYHNCHDTVALGSDYCEKHINSVPANKERDYVYQLGKAQERFRQFSDNPRLKDLDAETAVLKMMLENVVKTAAEDGPNALILVTPQVSQLTNQITQMRNVSHKIELQTGELLSKNKVVQFADEMVRIIEENIDDAQLISKIGNEIALLLTRLNESEEE